MSDGNFRQAVLAAWGDECLVRVRFPEAWLNTTSGTRYQDTLSLHHINGDDTDDRVANVIPLYQSCYIHIHKVDEHPYRQGHRQLPIEHRNAWNPHYKEYYEGPRLNSKQAGWFFGDDDAESQRESGVGEHRFEQVGCSLWVLLGGQLTHLRKGGGRDGGTEQDQKLGDVSRDGVDTDDLSVVVVALTDTLGDGRRNVHDRRDDDP